MNWKSEFRIDAVPLSEVVRHYANNLVWSFTPFNHDAAGVAQSGIFRGRTSSQQITVPIVNGWVIFPASTAGRLNASLVFADSVEWAAPGARQLWSAGLNRWLVSFDPKCGDVRWGTQACAQRMTDAQAAFKVPLLCALGFDRLEKQVVRPLWGIFTKGAASTKLAA